MKRILALILVFIMLLAECSCASAASATKKSNSSKPNRPSAIPIASAVASSELIENGLRYRAEQAVDGKISTCWVEGASGYGEGQTITLYLDGIHNVSKISIAAGWTINDQLFYKNARPKTLYVYFSSLPYEHYEVKLDNTMSVQSIDVDERNVSWVRFELGDVYKGEKGVYDTCISEITLYE